jgi:hypothetical protein
MAQWWICPSDGQVTIDDASISGLNTSPVASNVFLLFWHGDHGEIMRKQDATMPVREKFIDPTPYLPIFDRFLLAGENETPPLTLAQAKRIKQSLLESLFNMKRQQSYNGIAQTDTFQVAAIGSLTSAGVVDAVNAAIDTLNANLANLIRYYVDLNNAIIKAGAYLAAINAAIDSIQVTVSGGGESGYTTNVTFTPMPEQFLYELPVPSAGQYMPHVTLAANSTAQMVNAVSARTYSLSNVWVTKFNEIEACTTIPQVAAYDIVSGW